MESQAFRFDLVIPLKCQGSSQLVHLHALASFTMWLSPIWLAFVLPHSPGQTEAYHFILKCKGIFSVFCDSVFISGGKQCSLPLGFFFFDVLYDELLEFKGTQKSLNIRPYPWAGLYINMTRWMDQLNETDIFEDLLWARQLSRNTRSKEGKQHSPFLLGTVKTRRGVKGNRNTKFP